MIKHWTIRIFIGLFVCFIMLLISVFIFVKTTLDETSINVLEEKIQKNFDPYKTTKDPISLEAGSLVKYAELKSFHLFTAEKESFDDFIMRSREEGLLLELKGLTGILQVNQNVTFLNLLSNDCKELYCYQHYMPFEYIPSIFWKGLIGVEDQRYLDHFGVDLKSLFRALITNLKKMKYAQGGSTISQQLVKNIFFTNEKTFIRKLKEIVVSIYIETLFPKEKILEAYLNEVHWGALQGVKIKGVHAASLFYFGKKAADITSFEGAILISLLKGPGYFHPLKNLARLQERAVAVYKKLILENSVPNDLSLIWKENDWNKWIVKLKASEKAGYGQSIWRTINDIEPTLSEYEKFVLIQKVSDVKLKISEKYNNKFNTADISVKVLLGPLNANSWYSYYSRVERNKEKAIQKEKHQVGSSIKPIIYSVFEDLGRKMDDFVSTDSITLKLKSGLWSPKEGHTILESKVTMTEALMKSYNLPVIRVAQEIGFPIVEEKMKYYFKDLKIPLADYPSELLGSMEMSISELRDVYVNFIRTECGKIKNNERFMDQSVLQIMSDPNQTTVEKNVDIVMQKLRFFGKTGTTNNGYDNWYVAFDGKNITLIWVGYEGERKTKSLGLYGATTAFDVFQNYYRDRGRRFQQFGCELIN